MQRGLAKGLAGQENSYYFLGVFNDGCFTASKEVRAGIFQPLCEYNAVHVSGTAQFFELKCLETVIKLLLKFKHFSSRRPSPFPIYFYVGFKIGSMETISASNLFHQPTNFVFPSKSYKYNYGMRAFFWYF